MQTLPIISVNIWDMLYALLNLLILFLLVKKFLYKPVKKMLANRQATIDNEYKNAEDAKEKALSDQKLYEEKLSHAEEEADSLIQSAVLSARSRESQLELKKAEQTIREEIVSVGTVMAGKLLEREVNTDDHQKMIDSFLNNIGE